MSKFGDDIRKIANWKPKKDADDTNPPSKGELPGERGIAYFDPWGNLTSTTASPGSDLSLLDVGTALDQLGTDELAEAEEQTKEDVNPESDQPRGRGARTNGNSIDMEDLIDGLGDLGENPNASLDEITGIFDIPSDTEFNLRLDGTYNPPAATVGSPTSLANGDWQSYDDPPDAEDWIAGAWYSFTDPLGLQPNFVSSKYGDGIEWLKGATNGLYVAFTEWVDDGIGGTTYGPPTAAHLATISGTNASVTFTVRFSRSDGPGTSTENFSMFACNMPTPPFTLTPYCPITNPGATYWPQGHQTSLSLQTDGMIKSALLDNSILGKKYREGVSTLVFNFGAGGSRIGVVEPGIANSFLVYEVDSGGAAISDIRQYTKGEIKHIYGKNVFTKPRTLIRTAPAADVSKYRVVQAAGNIIRVNGFVQLPYFTD